MGAGVFLRGEDFIIKAIGVLAYSLSTFRIIIVLDTIIAFSIGYLLVDRLLDI